MFNKAVYWWFYIHSCASQYIDFTKELLVEEIVLLTSLIINIHGSWADYHLYSSNLIRGLLKWNIQGAATSRKKKISKKYNIGFIDLKFTHYIPMMVSDIVYKWKSDQTSMTSIIEIEIWNSVWLNLRSLLTNDHLAFCDYLH